MSDMQNPNPTPNPNIPMPNVGKIDIMKIQQTLNAIKEGASFNLIDKYHAWEQEAQNSKEKVLWNPKFRETIVSAFSDNPEIKALVEKLYLQILNELYDAQEAIRDKIRKATSELLDEATRRLGV